MYTNQFDQQHLPNNINPQHQFQAILKQASAECPKCTNTETISHTYKDGWVCVCVCIEMLMQYVCNAI